MCVCVQMGGGTSVNTNKFKLRRSLHSLQEGKLAVPFQIPAVSR